MSIFSKLFSSRKKEDSISNEQVQDSSKEVRTSITAPEVSITSEVPKDIPSALLNIIKSRGDEALYQPVLINILNDYHLFAGQMALKNGFRQIQQNGYIQSIINSSNWELDCASIALKITNELGIQNRIVSYIVSSIGYGLGKNPTLPVLEEQEEQLQNLTSHSHSDDEIENQSTTNYVPTSELSSYILPKDELPSSSTAPLFQILRDYDSSNYKLPVILQCDSRNGNPEIVDLAICHHIIIGGATLTGKSTLIHSMIATLLFHKHPAELKLVLMDGKGLEFGCYENLKNHFLAKRVDADDLVITNKSDAIETLNSLATEIDNRLDLLRKAKSRNVETYNNLFTARILNPTYGHRYLPYIVLVIDEYSTFMSKDFERAVMTIGQKGATVGIHMIISTSQVDKDTLSLQLRQQFPMRVAFKTLSVAASRLLISNGNSSKLAPRGKAIWADSSGNGDEIATPDFDYDAIQVLVGYICKQQGYGFPYTLAEPFISWTSLSTFDVWDPLLEEVAYFVVQRSLGSTSSLQRRFNLGYARAGKIMDQLEQLGIVSPAQGAKPRQVLVDSVRLEEILQNIR